MSDLTRFRDHCAAMATSDHRQDCIDRQTAWRDRMQLRRWWDIPDPGPEPVCDGCMTPTDRELFARLAAEVDDYRSPQVDLFGDLTLEPKRDAP